MTEDKLQELVERAQTRDSQAFGTIYDEYYDRIFNYIYRRILNVTEAEDICSNSFFKILDKIESFRWQSKSNFTGWMYRIATNEINQYFRSKGKYQNISSNHSTYENHAEIDENSIEKAEKDLQSNQEFLAIQKAISRLKPFYQQILHLRYFEDLSFEEISIATNKSQGTIRVNLHRAIEKLKDLLSDDAINFLNN